MIAECFSRLLNARGRVPTSFDPTIEGLDSVATGRASPFTAIHEAGYGIVRSWIRIGSRARHLEVAEARRHEWKRRPTGR